MNINQFICLLHKMLFLLNMSLMLASIFFVLFLFPFCPTSPVGIPPYYQPTKSYVSMTVFACMACHTELKCGFKIFYNMRKWVQIPLIRIARQRLSMKIKKYYHSDITLLKLSPSYVLVYCKQLTEFVDKAQRKTYTSRA